MGMELSKDIKNLVDRPNFGHLATLMPDGSPHSAPVWLGREGDFILIITEGSSLKGKNTLGDPRVSLSIVDFHDPYTEAQIRGRVVERRPDPKLKYYDAFSQKYIGKPWPYRDEGEPIVLVIEATKPNFRSSPSSTILLRAKWSTKN